MVSLPSIESKMVTLIIVPDHQNFNSHLTENLNKLQCTLNVVIFKWNVEMLFTWNVQTKQIYKREQISGTGNGNQLQMSMRGLFGVKQRLYKNGFWWWLHNTVNLPKKKKNHWFIYTLKMSEFRVCKLHLNKDVI